MCRSFFERLTSTCIPSLIMRNECLSGLSQTTVSSTSGEKTLPSDESCRRSRHAAVVRPSRVLLLEMACGWRGQARGLTNGRGERVRDVDKGVIRGIEQRADRQCLHLERKGHTSVRFYSPDKEIADGPPTFVHRLIYRSSYSRASSGVWK